MSSGLLNGNLWGTIQNSASTAKIVDPGLKERRRSDPKVYQLYAFLDQQRITPEVATEAFNRKNGKVHKYTSNGRVQLRDGRLIIYRTGDLYAATLEMNINNINRAGSSFKLDPRTVPTLALEANMTPDFLVALILSSEYADSRFGRFVLENYV